MKNPISKLSKAIVFVASLAFVAALFLPFWRIDLVAPQYPEGLVMKIYANKLGGNVDIINGLNHYIGMREIHEKDFLEFKVLPYLMILLALVGLVVVFSNRRSFLVFHFILFLVISCTAMIDFYRWEYDYGHNLNPEAAIRVPGMAYQPPLIGYKKLLNFEAYSQPDYGGWVFIIAGLLLAVAMIVELRQAKKKSKAVVTAAAILVFALPLSSCTKKPQPIAYGKDGCTYCKMTIMDNRFACEIVSKTGKAYKFDDLQCMHQAIKSGLVTQEQVYGVYVSTFTADHQFVDANKSFMLASKDLNSPMGGNIATFVSEDSFNHYLKEMNGTATNWKEINQ